MARFTSSRGPLISAAARTYAQALFELIEPTGVADEVLDELDQIVRLLGDEPKLGLLFEHRMIDPKRRSETIRRLFTGRVHDLTLRFLLVLNGRGRLVELPAIVRALDRKLKDHRGQVDADVYTARPLESDQTAEIARRLSAALQLEAVVRPHTDERLIGGLKVQFDGKLVDASVASQLRRLARRLSERGRESLRNGASRAMLESGPKD